MNSAKTTLAVAGVAVIAAIGGAGYVVDRQTKQTVSPTASPTVTASPMVSPTPVAKASDTFQFLGTPLAAAKGDSGLYEVTGTIKNISAATHSAALTATFVDKAGKILGTAQGVVSGVGAGETKAYDVISPDLIPAYDHINVQVDTVL